MLLSNIASRVSLNPSILSQGESSFMPGGPAHKSSITKKTPMVDLKQQFSRNRVVHKTDFKPSQMGPMMAHTIEGEINVGNAMNTPQKIRFKGNSSPNFTVDFDQPTQQTSPRMAPLSMIPII